MTPPPRFTGSSARLEVLVVTATATEGAPLRTLLAEPEPLPLRWGAGVVGLFAGARVAVAHFGVGKVNTAAGLGAALALEPGAVVQVGIGGAYVGAFVAVGAVLVAESELDLDAGLAGGDGGRQGMAALGFPLVAGTAPGNRFPTDPELRAALAAGLASPPVAFATSDAVTADFDRSQALQEAFDVSVESMEGAAAAQVCQAAGIPFGELRAISNIAGERDKRAWNLPGAIRVAAEAAEAGLRRYLSSRSSETGASR